MKGKFGKCNKIIGKKGGQAKDVEESGVRSGIARVTNKGSCSTLIIKLRGAKISLRGYLAWGSCRDELPLQPLNPLLVDGDLIGENKTDSEQQY